MKSANKVVNMLPERADAALPTYPQLSQFEQLERDLMTAMTASGGLKVAMQSHNVDRLPPAIAGAQCLISSGKIATLRRELPRALSPATVEEIGARIAALIKSIPNPGKEDLEIYARLLTDDVGAQSPTRLGLEIACRRLRRTAEWLPKIAQVLTALEKIEAGIRDAPRSLEELPALVEQAQKRLEEEWRWRRREEERGLPDDHDVGARLRSLADELRERTSGKPAPPSNQQRGSEPVSAASAAADALAGVRTIAEAAGPTAKEAMAKHRSRQASELNNDKPDPIPAPPTRPSIK
jgi:hypothetical protein